MLEWGRSLMMLSVLRCGRWAWTGTGQSYVSRGWQEIWAPALQWGCLGWNKSCWWHWLAYMSKCIYAEKIRKDADPQRLRNVYMVTCKRQERALNTGKIYNWDMKQLKRHVKWPQKHAWEVILLPICLLLCWIMIPSLKNISTSS